MLTVDQAIKYLLEGIRKIDEYEILDTLDCNRRVLYENIISKIDVPTKDNSQMDGYAINSNDFSNKNQTFKVVQRIPAGYEGKPLKNNEAARIFTGANIPKGADTVVMQEQVFFDEKTNSIQIKNFPQKGDWIRKIGEDIKNGNLILSLGKKLRPQELGLIASIGISKIKVFRKLKVAIFFTGDELVMPGEILNPGEIYNSNKYLINSLLKNFDCDVTDFGIIPDSLEKTTSVLRMASNEHDLIITSGGVSVGEEDYIKPAVQKEGKLNLWKISVKPGKPLAFGEIINKNINKSTYFLGLPGNPVSAFVTFLIFVRPFILSIQGISSQKPKSFQMRADFELINPNSRNEFLRVKINEQGGLDLFPNQGSAVLTSTVWGDGLIDNPPSNKIFSGDNVKFIPFSELIN